MKWGREIPEMKAKNGETLFHRKAIHFPVDYVLGLDVCMFYGGSE